MTSSPYTKKTDVYKYMNKKPQPHLSINKVKKTRRWRTTAILNLNTCVLLVHLTNSVVLPNFRCRHLNCKASMFITTATILMHYLQVHWALQRQSGSLMCVTEHIAAQCMTSGIFASATAANAAVVANAAAASARHNANGASASSTTVVLHCE